MLCYLQISKALQIENSNLEVAVPDTEYPHNINPIGIHEMLTWFKLDNSTKKHISIYNDEGVLFARLAKIRLYRIYQVFRYQLVF